MVDAEPWEFVFPASFGVSTVPRCVAFGNKDSCSVALCVIRISLVSLYGNSIVKRLWASKQVELSKIWELLKSGLCFTL